GNFIGTDVTGTQALSNLGYGVLLSDATSYNTIGGTAPGAGNVIAANSFGVVLYGYATSYNTGQGNHIGTTLAGTPLGNQYDGVILQYPGCNLNTIGGSKAGAGNTIAYNGHDGVCVDGGLSNAIQSNTIFA